MRGNRAHKVPHLKDEQFQKMESAMLTVSHVKDLRVNIEIRRVLENANIQAQHGPVRVIVRDGKPITDG